MVQYNHVLALFNMYFYLYNEIKSVYDHLVVLWMKNGIEGKTVELFMYRYILKNLYLKTYIILNTRLIFVLKMCQKTSKLPWKLE